MRQRSGEKTRERTDGDDECATHETRKANPRDYE